MRSLALALVLAACNSPGYDPENPGRVSCGCNSGDECYEAAASLDAKGETAETGEQLLYYAQCACFEGAVGGCNTVSHFAKDHVAACKANRNVRDSCAIAGFVYRHGVQVPSLNGRSFDRDPAASAAAFRNACSAGAQIACSYAHP
jgi:organic hydroperoxide reductase OsmC/OhrA